MSYEISSRTALSALNEVYAMEYGRGGMRHDSPDLSRIHMVERIKGFLFLTADMKPTIVNIGAGAQAIEQQLRATAMSGIAEANMVLRQRIAESRMISTDIAPIPRRRLLNHKYTPHIRADNRALPFDSESIDLTLSNHSIDMLRVEPEAFETALKEVYRVLKPDGLCDFAFHHSSLFDRLVARYSAEPAGSAARFFYDPNRPNPYFSTIDQIEQALGAAGLSLEACEPAEDEHNVWWELSAQKHS